MLEIKRKDNESSTSALRRFTRKVQQSGNLAKVRSFRFAKRATSNLTKKTEAIKKIKKAAIKKHLYKLGKI